MARAPQAARQTAGCPCAGVARPLHFRGELYQLGRLQFERARLGERTGAGASARPGIDAEPGDARAWTSTSPTTGARSTPGGVRRLASALAGKFFARHFPEETLPGRASATPGCSTRSCGDYLPEPTPTFVRFQECVPDRLRGRRSRPTREPVGFVFGNPELPVADLPQHTAVQRAVTRHLLGGGHWYLGHGWFEL